MKRKLLIGIGVIMLVFPSIFPLNADIGNRAVFHEDVFDGAEFTWEVSKWEIKEKPSPEFYTFFEEGDTIRMEINGTLPEELIVWYFHIPAGIIEANWYKNDIEFNPLETEGIARPYSHSFIFPIQLIEDNVTSDYFDYYYELVDILESPGLQTRQNLGSRYYEVTYEFTDTEYSEDDFSFKYYRKYDRETGILVQYRETTNYPAANTRLEVEFTTKDYEIVSINLPLISSLISIVVLTLVISMRKRK